MDHLCKVLQYTNYPKRMIDQCGRNNSPEGRLIDLETGNEAKKSIFISASYFPGLSESFKQLFKYTPVQVCFKGQNTIKSVLMHTKDKVDPSLKKDVIINGHAQSLIANLPTSERPPGLSLTEYRSMVRRDSILLSICIVPPKAIHYPTLINSKL